MTLAYPVSDSDAAILRPHGVDLLQWIERETGARVTRAERTSGGNRCEGWRIDVALPSGQTRKLFLRFQPRPPAGIEPYSVRREAEIYAALSGTDVPAPRLVAIHPELHAMVTECAPGMAEFRRLKDPAEQAAIARDCIHALVALHRLDARKLHLPSLGHAETVNEAVTAELDLWHALYQESGRTDPLIEFGFDWMRQNMPDVRTPPVLVHGDAGTGNFLFENGRMTALLDWELSHLGDPMEDLAWFCMRSVMEPVPDMPARIREYRAARLPVDFQRIEYHRVFVSLRIVIIRHRNVTGEPGNSIVSRGLNRRLLMDAIVTAMGRDLPKLEPVEAPEPPETALYEQVLDDLNGIVARSSDGQAIAKAKSAAKITKYLREMNRIGGLIAERERGALERLLGQPLDSVEQGSALLTERLRAGSVDREAALAYFIQHAAWVEQLASGAMGGLAYRRYPDLA